MTNHKIIHQITNDLWAITPDYLQTLYLSAIDFDVDQGRDSGENRYFMRGSVAVVPVHGPLGKNLSKWDKMFGMSDYNDIEESMMAADADPNVSHILMHVDSPGGTVTGLPELAGRIRAMETPITAFTEGCAASAAYWIASQADNILLSETAEVGSVGVYVALLDQTGFLEKMGLKVNAISAGKHKLDYAPFKPLSEEARERLQANVDKWHARFKEEVTMKHNIPPGNMEGQTFEGYEAIEAGLASGVVNSLSDALLLLG
jgi:capsid assembly protease